MAKKQDRALPVLANDTGGPRVSDRQDRAIGMLVEGHREEFIAYVLGIEPSLLRSWKRRPRFRRARAARGGDVSWRPPSRELPVSIEHRKEEKDG